jgi:hypothetical protein
VVAEAVTAVADVLAKSMQVAVLIRIGLGTLAAAGGRSLFEPKANVTAVNTAGPAMIRLIPRRASLFVPTPLGRLASANSNGATSDSVAAMTEQASSRLTGVVRSQRQ